MLLRGGGIVTRARPPPRRLLALVVAVVAILSTTFVLTVGGGGGGGSAPSSVSFDLGALGTVVGTRRENDGVAEFLGLPFAVTPPDRFKPPVDWGQDALYSSSSGSGQEYYDATRIGPECPQLAAGPDGTTVEGDENCLYLNVFVPPAPATTTNASGLLAVMVFLHGGGLTSGSGGAYDGGALAVASNSIVVTTNYRLGALAMLAFDTAVTGAASSGNLGFLDQRSALRWVRDNAASFGGDASKVMLFGESAGGGSAVVHMAMNGSAGLFHSVALESPASYTTAFTINESLALTGQFAIAAGCGDSSSAVEEYECLLAMSASQIISVAGASLAKITVDGVEMTEAPTATAAAGELAALPTVLGSNTDEGWFFLGAQANEPMSYDAYVSYVRGEVGDNFLPQALEIYPGDNSTADSDNRVWAAALAGDSTITCPTRRLARSLAGDGGDGNNSSSSSIFLYRFDQTDSCSHFDASWGSTHTSELAFVFASWDDDVCAPSESEAEFATMLQAMWGNQALMGEPSPNSDPIAWPAFATESNENAVLLAGGASTVESGLSGDGCDLFDVIDSWI